MGVSAEGGRMKKGRRYEMICLFFSRISSRIDSYQGVASLVPRGSGVWTAVNYDENPVVQSDV